MTVGPPRRRRGVAAARPFRAARAARGRRAAGRAARGGRVGGDGPAWARRAATPIRGLPPAGLAWPMAAAAPSRRELSCRRRPPAGGRRERRRRVSSFPQTLSPLRPALPPSHRGRGCAPDALAMVLATGRGGLWDCGRIGSSHVAKRGHAGPASQRPSPFTSLTPKRPLPFISRPQNPPPFILLSKTFHHASLPKSPPRRAPPLSHPVRTPALYLIP